MYLGSEMNNSDVVILTETKLGNNSGLEMRKEVS